MMLLLLSRLDLHHHYHCRKRTLSHVSTNTKTLCLYRAPVDYRRYPVIQSTRSSWHVGRFVGLVTELDSKQRHGIIVRGMASVKHGSRMTQKQDKVPQIKVECISKDNKQQTMYEH